MKSNQIKSHLNILGSEGPTTDKASSQIRTASDPCRKTGRDSNLNKPRLKGLAVHCIACDSPFKNEHA